MPSESSERGNAAGHSKFLYCQVRSILQSSAGALYNQLCYTVCCMWLTGSLTLTHGNPCFHPPQSPFHSVPTSGCNGLGHDSLYDNDRGASLSTLTGRLSPLPSSAASPPPLVRAASSTACAASSPSPPTPTAAPPPSAAPGRPT